jgi:hypothetical protein
MRRKLTCSARQLGVKFGKNLIVTATVPGGWAAENEVLSGERITKVNGKRVKDCTEHDISFMLTNVRPLELEVASVCEEESEIEAEKPSSRKNSVTSIKVDALAIAKSIVSEGGSQWWQADNAGNEMGEWTAKEWAEWEAEVDASGREWKSTALETFGKNVALANAEEQEFESEAAKTARYTVGADKRSELLHNLHYIKIEGA